MSTSDSPESASTDSSSRWSAAVIGPVLLVIGVAVVATWWILGTTDEPSREPVAIEATGPRFSTVEELVAASQVVVRGTVTDVVEGRTITDPVDPTAGIRTQLAAVDVDVVFAGGDEGPLVVEQEAELLDGTPLRVNGVDPLRVGDTGYLFLVRGDSDDFPFAALVNEQGWVPIVDDLLAPIDVTDVAWSAYAGQPSGTLADTLAGALDSTD